MASTSTSLNMTTGHTDTTTKPHYSFKCDLETLDSFRVPCIVNAALNVPLAIVTTFANLLVLLAMRQVTSLRLPSKLLLCSLVLTDLGVGLVVQPQFAAFLFVEAFKPANSMPLTLRQWLAFTSWWLCSFSFYTMIAISLDRYAALFFHFKYQTIVTTTRVCIVLIFILMFSLSCSATRCWNTVVGRVLVISVVVICLIVFSVVCIKIYRRSRGHGQQSHPQAEQAGNTLNIVKYRRTASIMMWIYVIFIICYLPYICTFVIEIIGRYTALVGCISEFLFTILLLNSCINPFVYCLRLPEIRNEVKKQLRQFCCRSTQH